MTGFPTTPVPHFSRVIVYILQNFDFRKDVIDYIIEFDVQASQAGIAEKEMKP
jgi:hypothetical protein